MSEQEQITVEEADRLLLEGSNTTPAPEPEKEELEVETPEAEDEVTTTPAATEVEDKEEAAPTEAADDWMEQVPEDIRDRVKEHAEKLAAAEQRIRSDDGRVRAFQRQAEDLKRKLEAINKLPQQSAAVAELPSTPEEWQSVIDHDPQLAKAIDARVKFELQEFKKTQVDPFVQRQNTADELRSSDRVAHETAMLEEIIPGAGEIYKTPMFQGWLEHEAPPSMQRVMNESTDHRDYVAVFNQFAVTMINSGRVQPQGQTAPAVKSEIDPQKAQNIADSRAKKLTQTSVTTKQNLAPTPHNPDKEYTPEEADALIIAEWNKRNK